MAEQGSPFREAPSQPGDSVHLDTDWRLYPDLFFFCHCCRLFLFTMQSFLLFRAVPTKMTAHRSRTYLSLSCRDDGTDTTNDCISITISSSSEAEGDEGSEDSTAQDIQDPVIVSPSLRNDVSDTKDVSRYGTCSTSKPEEGGSSGRGDNCSAPDPTGRPSKRSAPLCFRC